MLYAQTLGALPGFVIGKSSPTPPDGVNPTTLTRRATKEEKQRYYTDGWRGGDQGSGPCRMGGLVSGTCVSKPDVLGFFQPMIQMTKTSSGKWNSSELAQVRSGQKDFGRRGDKQAWRIFFADSGNTLRYEYSPRDYESWSDPITDAVGYGVGKVTIAARDVVAKISEIVCDATQSKPTRQAVDYAAKKDGERYGQNAEAQQANAQMSAADADARVKAASEIACRFDAMLNKERTPTPPLDMQSILQNRNMSKTGTTTKLLSYHHKRRNKWYTWQVTGNATLGGALTCLGCGLGGTTLSELEAKATAVGAQFVGESANLPAGAVHAGEIDDPWYRTWWGIGLMVGAVGAGYVVYRKRK